MNTLLRTACASAFRATSAPADHPEKPNSIVLPWPPGEFEGVLSPMIVEDQQVEYGGLAAVINEPGDGGCSFPGATEVGVLVAGPILGIPDLSGTRVPKSWRAS